MPPRANWKGYLKLSLVSCSVALFPAASSSEKLSLHLLNRATGNRLKQQYVDSETGDVVEREERVKGYEVAKNEYIAVTDEDLDKIEIESSHTIDIESFVPRSSVDPVYFDRSYYIAPDDKVGEEAFIVIRDAMRQRDAAGIGRVVLYGRERMILLEPRSKGILGTVLHYDYEVRDDDAYFEEIPELKIGCDLLDLAEHIMDKKSAEFDPAKFKDRYQEAVANLVRSKQSGKPVKAAHIQQPSNVINLMDALRRSLDADKQDRAKNLDKQKTSSASQRVKPAVRKGGNQPVTGGGKKSKRTVRKAG